MYGEFYIWANAVLHMSASVMNRVRSSIGDEIKIFDEDVYKNIIKSDKLDKYVLDRFKKHPYLGSYIEEMKLELKSNNVGYISIDDEDYPESLKNIYDPPYILYYMGNIKLINERFIIAVVGSRKATDYGINVSKKIVTDLSNEGVVIVSGMARGIDSLAHKSCLESNGFTIAVMGTSIEKTYPKTSISLKKEIINNKGLVLSEYFIGSHTEPSFFAMRNRIISGLSRGVLVVEAEKKSGALITMDCALQQGRNAYAVPGSIFSSTSQGCNNIINQGAKAVQNSSDILEDYYDYLDNKNLANKNNNKKICKNSGKISSSCVNIGFDDIDGENISKEELFIIKILISKGVLNIDDLSVIAGYEITDLLYIVNKLLMKNLIVEEGFNKYAPNILR
ncbi:MAG: DNA-processing protein DprA [Peptostreptococcus sp.]|uniref:DNA-processing protein DprA n=1 Tax=Peptostreptococcus sp. TaxID=1262 RepID=UPI002FCADA49